MAQPVPIRTTLLLSIRTANHRHGFLTVRQSNAMLESTYEEKGRPLDILIMAIAFTVGFVLPSTASKIMSEARTARGITGWLLVFLDTLAAMMILTALVVLIMDTNPGILVRCLVAMLAGIVVFKLPMAIIMLNLINQRKR